MLAANELDLDRDGKLAIGLLTHSAKWLDAAKTLLEASTDKLHPGMDFAPPIHFLAMQCLECTLKSFLCARGVEQKDLKRTLRHDLIAIFARAKELGIEKLIPITPEMTERLAIIAPLYEGKDLQYFQGSGSRSFPLPVEVLDDVACIHNALDTAYRAHNRNPR